MDKKTKVTYGLAAVAGAATFFNCDLLRNNSIDFAMDEAYSDSGWDQELKITKCVNAQEIEIGDSTYAKCDYVYGEVKRCESGTGFCSISDEESCKQGVKSTDCKKVEEEK